eukprot:g25591.t1
MLSACTQDTAVQLQNAAKQMRQRNYTTYMQTKNKKLEKLGITTNNNQVFLGTTFESGNTTGKSIVNLSDQTLQLDKINVLSWGLSFCPITKMDPIGEKESNWTPPEGRCPEFDRYAQATREHVNARFISPSHKLAQHVTQTQCNDLHVLKTNHNIVIKSAGKGGAIVIQNRMDYYKEV